MKAQSIERYPKQIDSINKGRITYELWKKRPQYSYRFAVVVRDHKYPQFDRVINTFKTESEARSYMGI